MNIANVIKELRATLHWEQEDLAKRIGTSQQTISNWETGSLPRAAALEKLNEILTEAGFRRSPSPPSQLKQMNAVAHLTSYKAC